MTSANDKLIDNLYEFPDEYYKDAADVIRRQEATVTRLEEENKKLRRLVDYYLHMA